MTGYAITSGDIVRAASPPHGKVLKTPLLPAPRLSELPGATILIKYENTQPTGSLKERGAYNKLISLSEDERRRGVIAMSAGNHAQGVAYGARQFGIPATIDFTIEARDAAHAVAIFTALEKDGLSPHLLSSLGSTYQG